MLAVLLVIAAAILEKLPPFSRSFTEVFDDDDVPEVVLPKPPKAPRAPKAPVVRIDKPRASPEGSSDDDEVSISIDKNGVRITRAAAQRTPPPQRHPRHRPPHRPHRRPRRRASRCRTRRRDQAAPAHIDSESVKEAVRDARAAVAEAIEDARSASEDARAASEEAAQAARDALAERRAALRSRRHIIDNGDFLTDIAWLFIAAVRDPEDHLQGPQSRPR